MRVLGGCWGVGLPGVLMIRGWWGVLLLLLLWFLFLLLLLLLLLLAGVAERRGLGGFVG